MALAGGRGFTERFLLFNSSPHLLRSFRKRQAAGSHAGRHEGGREADKWAALSLPLPPCILAGGRMCSPIIAAWRRRAVVRLCNEISPALFVIRACIMAFFLPARRASSASTPNL